MLFLSRILFITSVLAVAMTSYIETSSAESGSPAKADAHYDQPVNIFVPISGVLVEALASIDPSDAFQSLSDELLSEKPQEERIHPSKLISLLNAGAPGPLDAGVPLRLKHGAGFFLRAVSQTFPRARVFLYGKAAEERVWEFLHRFKIPSSNGKEEPALRLVAGVLSDRHYKEFPADEFIAASFIEGPAEETAAALLIMDAALHSADAPGLAFQFGFLQPDFGSLLGSADSEEWKRSIFIGTTRNSAVNYEVPKPLWDRTIEIKSADPERGDLGVNALVERELLHLAQEVQSFSGVKEKSARERRWRDEFMKATDRLIGGFAFRNQTVRVLGLLRIMARRMGSGLSVAQALDAIRTDAGGEGASNDFPRHPLAYEEGVKGMKAVDPSFDFDSLSGPPSCSGLFGASSRGGILLAQKDLFRRLFEKHVGSDPARAAFLRLMGF